MKCLSMGALSTKQVFLLLALLVFSAGCNQGAAIAAESNCDLTHVKIIQSVLGDPELRKYGNAYFDGKSIRVIWDERPTDSSACNASGLGFSVTNSLGADIDPGSRYVGVMKMYFDKDAAFIEIKLEPTGKNGDFFLRNNGGWRIVQKSLYETR